ncbi:MAG: hypothetical protein K0S83_756 [Thermomicrobiales bacterium]|nr:hypothetical protein [Thermomicrobiales bacterium]
MKKRTVIAAEWLAKEVSEGPEFLGSMQLDRQGRCLTVTVLYVAHYSYPVGRHAWTTTDSTI